ncbi:MAG: hypothetical protein JXB10_17675 [Pirellulales bacterium]|nr:hypothetical protein [Pirellulales bacterium]
MSSTKSSGAVFIRAGIMLAFLAAIPLVALSGNSLPEMIRKALGKYLPILAGNQSKNTPAALANAPLFDGAKAIGGNAGSAYAARDQFPANRESRPIALENPLISPSGLSQAAILPTRVPDTAVVPTKYQTPLKSAALPSGISTPGSQDLFLQIQNRLRSLGATYYLLETWGNDQRLYRFYCEMAVAGNGNFTRCFESTHSNPLEAMRAVLTQAENWRAGVK